MSQVLINHQKLTGHMTSIMSTDTSDSKDCVIMLFCRFCNSSY